MFGSVKSNQEIQTNGIGLGLVISKLIVNEFDGVIDFFSKYKKGSTFFFIINLDQENLISRVESSIMDENISNIKFMQAKRALNTI